MEGEDDSGSFSWSEDGRDEGSTDGRQSVAVQYMVMLMGMRRGVCRSFRGVSTGRRGQGSWNGTRAVRRVHAGHAPHGGTAHGGVAAVCAGSARHSMNRSMT